MDEIYDGVDELGALLMGHERGAYWFGSRISVHEARKLAPFNNATSIQVAAGVMGGVVWAMENPRAGIIDPDDVDFQRVLEIANPYLGQRRRRLQRLDAARRAQPPVPGRPRYDRSLAVQELPGRLRALPAFGST